jgi:hypothetical protein
MAGWVEGEPKKTGYYWVEFEDDVLCHPVYVQIIGGLVRHKRLGQEGWKERKITRWAEMASCPRPAATCPGSGAEPADRPKGSWRDRLETVEVLAANLEGRIQADWEHLAKEFGRIKERLSSLEDTARWENKGTSQELEGRVANLESHRDWTMRAVADLLDRVKRMEPDRRDQHNRIVVLEAKLTGVRLALADGPDQEDE